MAVPDRELEFSPLSGRVSRHGVTVQVHIYRFVAYLLTERRYLPAEDATVNFKIKD